MSDQYKCPLQNDECAVCLEQKSAEITRRSFFASLLGACAGLIATVIGMPMFRYILYPVQAGTRSDKWTEIGDVSEFDNLNTPVTKTISLVQRDGWREATECSRCCRRFVRISGARWRGMRARTSSSARAMAVNSALTESASPDRHLADWIPSMCKSRKANCRCSSSISVPMFLTANF